MPRAIPLYLSAPELDAETPLDEAVARLGWHLLAGGTLGQLRRDSIAPRALPP